MELQDKRKPISDFFRSKYVKAFLCYGLGSCGLYFLFMFIHGGPIEADIYLAINLIVSVVLWFLIGLAINHRAEKAPNDKVPAFKIIIAAAALIVFYQVVTVILAAVMVRHPEMAVPIIGDWLAFRVTPNFIYSAEGSIQHSIFTAIPVLPHLISLPLVLLLGIFMYRAFCFTDQANKRILAIFLMFFIAGILSGNVAGIICRGRFNFITVRNFIDLSVQNIFDYVVILVVLQLAFFESKKPSESKDPSPGLKAYFKYEADNIRAVVSKLRKGKNEVRKNGIAGQEQTD